MKNRNNFQLEYDKDDDIPIRDPVYHPVGFEEDLPIFTDTESNEFLGKGPPLRRLAQGDEAPLDLVKNDVA